MHVNNEPIQYITCRIYQIMSHHNDRTSTAVDTDSNSQHRHLHVKSFAKMDSPAQQRQQHEQHLKHQDHIPMCESPSPKIKRKIGNEVNIIVGT